MTRTTFGYVMRLYLAFVVAVLGVVLVIYLIADAGDRVKMFANRDLADVLELYRNKALVATLQLGPAALLLAASATVTTLRRRGELSALRSLTFGTRVVYFPILFSALALSFSLVAFDEWWVVKAGERVDELTVKKFNTWGDWRFFYSPKQWFRRGNRIFHLRYGDVDRGFDKVTVLNLDTDFRLVSRLDAEHMDFIEKNDWRLTGVVERSFSSNASVVTRADLTVKDLGLGRGDLQIRQGRPEQMPVPVLWEQIAIRRKVGLSIRQFQLALHNRFAYPLTGMAAAMLAVGLSLRSGRKGLLTVALMEGFAIALLLWSMMGVARALVLGEHAPAWLAAWTPMAILCVLGGFLWARHEGYTFSFFLPKKVSAA